MKLIAICALALFLQGCFFVYVPGPVVDSVVDRIDGVEGDNCVGAGAKVGDRVRTSDGRELTVASLSGTSPRCQQPNLPIRARLVVPPVIKTARAKLTPSNQTASADGPLVGAFTFNGSGNGTIATQLANGGLSSPGVAEMITAHGFRAKCEFRNNNLTAHGTGGCTFSDGAQYALEY
jgi:hypothetical protein